MFDSGISFEWILGMNLLVTGLIWLRTFCLLPLGWIRAGENMNLFHQSAVFNKFSLRESLAKQARTGIIKLENYIRKIGTAKTYFNKTLIKNLLNSSTVLVTGKTRIKNSVPYRAPRPEGPLQIYFHNLSKS